MRFGVLIMTITRAQILFVVIKTVNTLKMLSLFTCRTNQSLSSPLKLKSL